MYIWPFLIHGIGHCICIHTTYNIYLLNEWMVRWQWQFFFSLKLLKCFNNNNNHGKKNFNWTISKVCVCMFAEFVCYILVWHVCLSIYLSILWFWIEKKINYHYDDDDIDHHNHQCYILVDRTKQQQQKKNKKTNHDGYICRCCCCCFFLKYPLHMHSGYHHRQWSLHKKEREIISIFFSCFTIHLDRQCKLYIIHSRHITIIIIITTIITMIYDG